MNDFDMIDVSDEVKKKQDKFMKYIYLSLIILIILATLIYFFGYDVLKTFIKV